MNAATLLITLSVIITALADSDCPDKPAIPALKLKKHLMCGYERTLRPVKTNQDAVKVVIRMVLKYFLYNHHDNSFTVDSWLALFWKDEHLKWNPKNFDSITAIHLSMDQIWMPDLSVYNRHDQGGSPAAVESATCIVSSAGQVVCVPPTRQVSLCVADLSRYPFDTQNCTIRVGSWVHSGEEIDLRLAKPAITTDDLVPNGEWGLVTTNVIKHPGKFECCANNTYPSINFSFKIKRLAGAHAASVILPLVALIIVTLTSLWIPANHNDRMNLCSLNLICQLLFNQYISWMIPLNGDKIPYLILFSRDSLLLTAFTIILTVVLRRFLEKQNPPPAWISTIVSVVMGCAPGRCMFLDDTTAKNTASLNHEEDAVNIIHSNYNNTSQDWAIFAKILDRLCFVAYCIVYFVMFLTFTP